MGETNKKEAVAALHRARIMTAAEKLFSEKGYEQTTIEDISKESEYSRRTIYAYYESKDDILHCIIEKGLQALKTDIENAANDNAGFTDAYRAVCRAMRKYRREYPYSLERLNRSGDEEIGRTVKSAAAGRGALGRGRVQYLYCGERVKNKRRKTPAPPDKEALGGMLTGGESAGQSSFP